VSKQKAGTIVAAVIGVALTAYGLTLATADYGPYHEGDAGALGDSITWLFGWSVAVVGALVVTGAAWSFFSQRRRERWSRAERSWFQ
jgi:hypothetical protein